MCESASHNDRTPMYPTPCHVGCSFVPSFVCSVSPTLPGASLARLLSCGPLERSHRRAPVFVCLFVCLFVCVCLCADEMVRRALIRRLFAFIKCHAATSAPGPGPPLPHPRQDCAVRAARSTCSSVRLARRRPSPNARHLSGRARRGSRHVYSGQRARRGPCAYCSNAACNMPREHRVSTA